MERIANALNRAAESNAVVNTFLGAAFCAMTARAWGQDKEFRALEAEKQVLATKNKEIRTTIWEWRQTLYAEASANPRKALVPLSTLQSIYGDVVTAGTDSGEDDKEEEKPPKIRFMV